MKKTTKASILLILLPFLILTLNLPIASSSEDNPLDVSIGSIRTEGEKAAVGFLIKYAEKINDNYLLSNADPKNSNSTSGWLFDVSPELEIQTAEQDSFNGIIAKMTGNYIRFNIKEIPVPDNDPVLTPDSSEMFHVFPMSIGFESDRNFENVSALVEVGYVPFSLQNKFKKTIGRIGLDTKLGLFLQGGYKFEVEDSPAIRTGGAIDESAEKPDSEISRIKVDAGTNIRLITYSKGKRSISIIPRARLWYDFVNSETYHKYEATLQFVLDKDKSFDFRYEDGSGAPNFNEGDQFSTNLTLKF